MPILFTCPHCGLQTNVADQYAGQTGPCARCGKPVTVPGAAPFGADASPPPPSSSGTSTAIVIVAVVLVVFLVCGGMAAFLFLPVLGSRETSRRAQCTNNLKQIGLALHNYHDVYMTFPAASMASKDGKAVRSWRVAVLPFLEQQPLANLYDFGQPWDSPRNRAVSSVSISTYRCPSDSNPQPTATNYVMLAGKGTIGGEPNEWTSMAKITDGTSNTILAVEVAGRGIQWAEPKDMTVDEFVAYMAAGASGGPSPHPGGCNVLMADGSVRFLSFSTDRETLRRLALRDDGNAVPVF